MIFETGFVKAPKVLKFLKYGNITSTSCLFKLGNSSNFHGKENVIEVVSNIHDAMLCCNWKYSIGQCTLLNSAILKNKVQFTFRILDQ